MPFDLSGTFTRNYTFESDRVNGIKIMSLRVDGEFDNFSTAMNQTLLRTGEAPMAANLRMGGFNLTGLGNGTVANPSIAWSNDASSGLYRVGSNQIGFAVAGVKKAEFNAAGFTASAGLTVAGLANHQGGVLNTGTFINRFENTSGSGLPAGSAGVGLEVFVSASTNPNIQGFNRTSVAYTPVCINATRTILSTNGGANYATDLNTSQLQLSATLEGGDVGLSIGCAANAGTNAYIQSHASRPLKINPLGNTVEVCGAAVTISSAGIQIVNTGSLRLGDNYIRAADNSARIDFTGSATVLYSQGSTGILNLSTAGDISINGMYRNTVGAVTAPGANAHAFLWRDATNGHSLQGSGSSFDSSLFNNAGNRVIGVNTGTYKAEYQGTLGGSQVSAEIGWRDLQPQSKTATYSIVLTDRGSVIPITTGGVTVPDNSSIAFPVGSIISVYNDSGSNQTISMLGTDTLRLAGTSSTGSRTLAQRGVGTLLKVKTTEWTFSGPGVS